MFNRASGFARAGLGLACMLSLVACGGGGGGGGGGGDGGGGPPRPPEAARLTLSGNNAARVSLEALQAAETSGSGADAATGGTSPSAARVHRALRRALARPQGPLAAAPVRPLATEDCTNGGSVTSTGAFTAIGDSVTLTFNNCNEDGTVANGSLRLTLVGGTQTSETFDVTLTDYQEAVGDLVERGNGTMRITFSEDAQTSTTAIRSDALTIERLVGGNVRASRSVRDLVSQDVFNAAGQTSTTSFVASGTFPELGEGSFQVETLAALVTPVGQDHPTAGQLRLSGAGGTSALLTVGADDVQIAIDTDGDGTADQNLTRAWDELLGLL